MAITYTPTTNFGAKDSLPTNDPDKVIKGSEFTTEFTALQTAFSLAAPNASPTFTGTVTIPTADINGGAIDGTTIGGTTPAAASFTTVSATGNITVGGTVDGRDVAADGTKLDGIEAGATADQTAAEIRALVEAATDSNVFTDADHTKLNGIEVLADVTDTANVTAAGALMDSELTDIAAVKALDQGVATTDSPSFAGLTATTADINGGTADGVVIGGSTPAAITGTTVTANTSLALATGATVTAILDEDNMASDSATALATQQSIKAYVDSQVGTVDTLAEILANGNTTGGTDIAVGTGDDITFADSSKAIFGAGSDLQIYHDGSHSYLTDAGTGDLRVGANNLRLQNADNTANYIKANNGSNVELFYNGLSKLATTATGIDVTGTVTADAVTLSAATALLDMYDSDGTNQRLRLLESGGSAYLRSQNDTSHGTIRLQTEDGTNIYDRLVIASNGDISFYEDTGTTESLVWDSSLTQLKITGRETSRGGGVYAFDVDNSAQLSNLTSAGAMRVKGFYGDSLIVNGLGDVSFFDDSGNAKFFWDASEERLGLGTTSPSAPLHIANATPVIRLEDTSASVSHYINSNNAELRVQAASILSLRTSVGEAMRIDDSGNVGIGTTSPTTSLVVGGDISSSVMSVSANPVLGLTGDILFEPGSGVDVEIRNYRTTNMIFGIGSSEAMRIDSSGNLLVGTTNTAPSVNNVAGLALLSSGQLQTTADGASAASFNRKTSDGSVINIRKNGATVGSIGTNSNTIYIDGSSANTGIQFAGSAWVPRDSGAFADNTVDVGTSTYRLKDLYLSGGVYLGGTGAANLLDDYEEGTWTPVLSDAQTGGNTATGLSILGIYTKVGNVVHATIRAINIDTTGMTAGNDLFIQGLPFTQNGSFNFMGAISAVDITFSGFLTLYGSGGNTVAKVNKIVSATGIDFITIGDLTSGNADIQADFTYRIS